MKITQSHLNNGPVLLRRGFLVCFLLLAYSAPGQTALRPPKTLPEYRLQVSFDLSRGKIFGQADILAPVGRKLTIDPGELRIVEIRHRGKKLAGPSQPGKEIVLHPEGPIRLIYEVDVSKTDDNTVQPGNILLLGMWYPLVEGFSLYKLTVTLPPDYAAVSEAERLTRTEKDGQAVFLFDLPHPLHDRDGITLAASNRWVTSGDTSKGIELVTYLFPEESHLAPRYLERAKRVLEKYEKLLSPYPYRRLAIVENSLEANQAMPTIVLLDRQEFYHEDLDRTALDHEIVHQWFGCNVSADYDHGNWCEGLAIYFAEHLLQEEKGRDWQCRRRILSGFQSHMQRYRDFPLRDFTERFDDPTRVLGYGKGAMVVHMLRRQVGDPAFFEAIRRFLQTNRFNMASWGDLQRSFEEVSHRNLGWFFEQWVNSTGQPEIIIEGASAKPSAGQFVMNLSLVQKGQAKRLSLPLRFLGPQSNRRVSVNLSQRKESFSFRLDFLPTEVVIDEHYDVFRKLAPSENPPTLERLLASRELLLVPPVDEAEKERYREIIGKFTAKGARLQKNPLPKQVPSTSFIVMGRENPWVNTRPGDAEPMDCAVTLRVRPHPQSPQHLMADVLAPQKVTAADIDKFLKYPFYSTYCVKNGQQISRTQAESRPGIRLQLPHPQVDDKFGSRMESEK